jgi:hypothetical protein
MSSTNNRKRKKRGKLQTSPTITEEPVAPKLVSDYHSSDSDTSPQIPSFSSDAPDGTFSFSDGETTKASPETPFTPDIPESDEIPALVLPSQQPYIQQTNYRRGSQRTAIHKKLGGQRRTWASTIKVKSNVPPITERRFEIKCDSCKADLEFGINDVSVNRPNPVYQLIGYEADMYVSCPVCTNDVDVKADLPEWLKKKL